MIFIYLVIVGVVGFFLGFFTLKGKLARLTIHNKALAQQLADSQAHCAKLNTDYQALNAQFHQQSDDYLVLKTEHKNTCAQVESLSQEISLDKQKLEIYNKESQKLNSDNATQQQYIKSLEKDNERLVSDQNALKERFESYQSNAEAQRQQLQQKNANQQVEIAELKKYIGEYEKSAKEKLALLEEAKQSLSVQFENLANRIFEEKGEKFTNQNKVNLSEVLQPFKQQMSEFKKKVDDVYIHEAKERASLKQEVNKLFELNQVMNQEAQNLTKALKGDKKLQGDWGEVVLERVLETSGLRKGYEYDTQLSFKNDEQKTFRPDVIVHLPDGKDVIVDAKVSLVSYDAYTKADGEMQKQQCLKKHIEAVRQHVSLLSEKGYENLSGINSLDFVLMFIPIEAAFVLAFQHDDRLFQEAFKKRIIIVTPTTLLATLGTIRNTWKYEQINKNAEEISDRAGKMLDKFRGFIEDIENLGKHIHKTQDLYDNSLNKLTKGRGNLIAQASQLKALGVQMKKDLPQSIIEQSEIE
ncbi:DNA recombination protein RmuC [Facilibium subflavum]|uniref:DNA recombination protein RmuC n=1 Tax=Facilibium subflavum TaxID=2219058 RepID=UPI000E65C5DF|nr:DNA recombination protein RmuC [Facilibium subflavum]